MKVLVDIGNSRIKWAVIDDNGLTESQSFQRGKTGIKTALNKAWKSLQNVESVHVANVAGEKLGDQVTEWSEKNWQITPVFIQSEKKRFGVTNAYEEADKLGIDRWLSLIAARQHARQAQCIIDCGTAMTIDIVTQNGQHQGGMILPGLSLMQSSLATNTDALTEEPDEKEFKTLATNTYSAIQAGTLYCITATLERIINDLRESFDNRIRFIITGGDAEHIRPLLPDDVHHYPDIVLKGLAFYARQKTSNDNAADDTDVDSDEQSNDETPSELEPVPTTTQTTAEEASDSAETGSVKPKAAKPKAAAKPRKPRRSKTKATAKDDKPSEVTLPEDAL